MPPLLAVELVPRTSFFTNLRSLLSTRDWDTLRQRCYQQAGYVCEICGGTGGRHPVECHEIWQYDDENHVQKLTGLIALCPACHKAKHMALARHMGWEWMAEKQLCQVNGWGTSELQVYLEEVFAVFESRSEHEWELDISWLHGSGVRLPPGY
jgi:hypothetical protein